MEEDIHHVGSIARREASTQQADQTLNSLLNLREMPLATILGKEMANISSKV